MNDSWDSELAALLTDLSAAQDETLEVLTKKRELLGASDVEGLAALGKQEDTIVEKLQQCLKRREELLRRAGRQGLPSNSIQSLTKALPKDRRDELSGPVRECRAHARLLRHHSLTNWVIAQRTLIHLSQMLEIIATGGRLQPTYGEEEPASAKGALVDQEA